MGILTFSVTVMKELLFFGKHHQQKHHSSHYTTYKNEDVQRIFQYVYAK
jgi:hypothetical protein